MTVDNVNYKCSISHNLNKKLIGEMSFAPLYDTFPKQENLNRNEIHWYNQNYPYGCNFDQLHSSGVTFNVLTHNNDVLQNQAHCLAQNENVLYSVSQNCEYDNSHNFGGDINIRAMSTMDHSQILERSVNIRQENSVDPVLITSNNQHPAPAVTLNNLTLHSQSSSVVGGGALDVVRNAIILSNGSPPMPGQLLGTSPIPVHGVIRSPMSSLSSVSNDALYDDCLNNGNYLFYSPNPVQVVCSNTTPNSAQNIVSPVQLGSGFDNYSPIMYQKSFNPGSGYNDFVQHNNASLKNSHFQNFGAEYVGSYPMLKCNTIQSTSPHMSVHCQTLHTAANDAVVSAIDGNAILNSIKQKNHAYKPSRNIINKARSKLDIETKMADFRSPTSPSQT